jgi:outer membrane protein assembly factor BamD
MRSYDALGMPQLRDDSRRVLEKTYPQSVYLTGNDKPRSAPWWQFW